MTTASDLINDARTYAHDSQQSAVEQLGIALQTINDMPSPPVIGPLPMAINPPAIGDPGSVPAYTGAHFERVPFDGVKPDLQPVSALVLPTAPGPAPAAIPFVDPAKPTAQPGNEALIASPPSVNPLDAIPAMPDLMGEIRGIVKPVLTPIVIPTAPTYAAPEFFGVRPTDPGAPPSGLDATLRAQYDQIGPVMRAAVTDQLDSFLDREFPQFRSGMAAIETRLATYLAGGSALSPATENQIFARTLDKMNAEAKRAQQETWSKAARAGHTIPGAILLNQLKDVDQARRDNNSRGAIEIAVKQAELEQQNLQFAVTASASLRHTAINAGLAYYSGLVQLNGQALEYARSVVDTIVKAYDIATKYAEVQARIYESDARVFEARLHGAMAELEAYEHQIRGLEAQANVDTARVNAFRALVESVKAEADVYRAQIEALLAKSSIEKLKVELYQARVQAYAAQVNAYTAQWQGYEAAVRGEAAKQQASAEQQRAFQSEVAAYSETVRALAVEIDSQVKTNESKMHGYGIEAQVYAAVVSAESEAVRAEILSYDETIKAFIAKSAAIADKSRAETARFETTQRAIVEGSRLFITTIQEAYRADITRIEAAAKVSEITGESYSKLAQSALSGMNSLAAQVASE